eukprot:gene695-1822_t
MPAQLHMSNVRNDAPLPKVGPSIPQPDPNRLITNPQSNVQPSTVSPSQSDVNASHELRRIIVSAFDKADMLQIGNASTSEIVRYLRSDSRLTEIILEPARLADGTKARVDAFMTEIERHPRPKIEKTVFMELCNTRHVWETSSPNPVVAHGSQFVTGVRQPSGITYATLAAPTPGVAPGSSQIAGVPSSAIPGVPLSHVPGASPPAQGAPGVPMNPVPGVPNNWHGPGLPVSTPGAVPGVPVAGVLPGAVAGVNTSPLNAAGT